MWWFWQQQCRWQHFAAQGHRKLSSPQLPTVKEQQWQQSWRHGDHPPRHNGLGARGSCQAPAPDLWLKESWWKAPKHSCVAGGLHWWSWKKQLLCLRLSISHLNNQTPAIPARERRGEKPDLQRSLLLYFIATQTTAGNSKTPRKPKSTQQFPCF